MHLILCNKYINCARSYYQTLSIIGTTKLFGLMFEHVTMRPLRCKLDGHRITLTNKKNVYIHLQKKKLYVKLTYCDYPNKNFEHFNLRMTKIWVQQKQE